MLAKRLMYKTEFEVEGWKKLVPVVELFEEFIPQIPIDNIDFVMTEINCGRPGQHLNFVKDSALITAKIFYFFIK